MKFMAWMRDLARDEEGASAIEYAILVTMVALVLVALIPDVQTAVTNVFTSIVTALTPAP